MWFLAKVNLSNKDESVLKDLLLWYVGYFLCACFGAFFPPFCSFFMLCILLFMSLHVVFVYLDMQVITKYLSKLTSLETCRLENSYRNKRPCTSRKLSFHLLVTTVRWAVAKAVTHRAGCQITWCSLFVFSCALLSHLGNLSLCLDVETWLFLSCTVNNPCYQGKQTAHPQVTVMLLLKLAVVCCLRKAQ